MDGLNLNREQVSPLCYSRHPFVYLLEAADDIAYNIIDFEDAHRIDILSSDEVKKEFLNLISCIGRPEDENTDIIATSQNIKDDNESISYLRSKAINALILQAADIFIENLDLILEGKYNNTLIDEIEENCGALQKIKQISNERIYNYKSVVELELAGYNVMNELLQTMIPSALKSKTQRTALDSKSLQLVPIRFGEFSDKYTAYQKALGILDFVSGMTDLYATELYRKIKGIEIGKHK